MVRQQTTRNRRQLVEDRGISWIFRYCFLINFISIAKNLSLAGVERGGVSVLLLQAHGQARHRDHIRQIRRQEYQGDSHFQLIIVWYRLVDRSFYHYFKSHFPCSYLSTCSTKPGGPLEVFWSYELSTKVTKILTIVTASIINKIT